MRKLFSAFGSCILALFFSAPVAMCSSTVQIDDSSIDDKEKFLLIVKSFANKDLQDRQVHVPQLLTIWSSDVNDLVKGRCLQLMRMIRDKRIVDVFLAELQSKSPISPFSADIVSALPELEKSERVARSLHSLAIEPKGYRSGIAQLALRSLGKCGSSSKNFLISIAKDQPWVVESPLSSKAYQEAMARSGDEESVRLLMKKLETLAEIENADDSVEIVFLLLDTVLDKPHNQIDHHLSADIQALFENLLPSKNSSLNPALIIALSRVHANERKLLINKLTELRNSTDLQTAEQATRSLHSLLSGLDVNSSTTSKQGIQTSEGTGQEEIRTPALSNEEIARHAEVIASKKDGWLESARVLRDFLKGSIPTDEREAEHEMSIITHRYVGALDSSGLIKMDKAFRIQALLGLQVLAKLKRDVEQIDKFCRECLGDDRKMVKLIACEVLLEIAESNLSK